MNKTGLIVTIGTLFLIANFSLRAQKIEIGAAAGFGISDLNLANSSETSFIYNLSPIASFNISGFLSYRNKRFWGFSVEPGIIRKGWNQSFDNTPKNKIRLYYLQLPVLSDFYLSEKLYFSVGPEIGYLLSAQNKYESTTQNIAEYLNRFELSGIAAVSYKLNEFSAVSFRYSHGITEISKNVLWTYSEYGVPDEPEDYNHYFQLLFKINLNSQR